MAPGQPVQSAAAARTRGRGGGRGGERGVERLLEINAQQAFLWIDSTNAFNTVCRQLIKETVMHFVPEWLNLYAACYEIKSELIIRTDTNEAAGIMSEEGVHQGCPLGPALFCLGLRLVHLLVRHARGDAVNPDYALQHETWQAVLTRFNVDIRLQERIRLLRAREQDFLVLDQYARPVQPEHVDPQHTLRAYMDDQ